LDDIESILKTELFNANQEEGGQKKEIRRRKLTKLQAFLGEVPDLLHLSFGTASLIFSFF
jgi:hypothetical protein